MHLYQWKKAVAPRQNGMCGYAQKDMAKGNPTRTRIGNWQQQLEFSLHSDLAYQWVKEKHTSASLERLCFCIRYFCMKEAGKSTSLGQGNKGAG
jgi:hypothetical protein